MRNEGLGSWPARRARKTPHRTALVHGEQSTDYRTLHTRTTRLAHALRARGIRRGDRIAYLGPNHPSYLETLFAAGTLGAVFVPLNTRLAGPEIAYQLADSGAKALVYGPTHAGARRRAARQHRRTDVRRGRRRVRGVAGRSPRPSRSTSRSRADDTCIIMYTSGTTGRPKGAMLTHGNLTWNAINVLVDTDLIADERALVSAPLFHTAGLNMLTLPVLLKGGTCVLVEAFDPDATFDLIERHRITFMFGVPTMFDQIARHPRWADADLSSLRILTCGGSPVPSPLIAAYQERGPDLPPGLRHDGGRPRNPLPGRRTRGEQGGFGRACRTSSATYGSYGRTWRPSTSARPARSWSAGRTSCPATGDCPRRRPPSFADGWFRSGDAARVDEDGYVFIVDRIKDMIISGGENIYPAEIEDLLLAHPDIVECAVIGVPGRQVGRGAARGRRAARGRHAGPRRGAGLAGRPARQVQDPQVGGDRGRTPAHRLRKAPQVPGAQALRQAIQLLRNRHL